MVKVFGVEPAAGDTAYREGKEKSVEPPPPNPQDGASPSPPSSSSSSSSSLSSSSPATSGKEVPRIFSWLIWPLLLALPLTLTVRSTKENGAIHCPVVTARWAAHPPLYTSPTNTKNVFFALALSSLRKQQRRRRGRCPTPASFAGSGTTRRCTPRRRTRRRWG